MNRKSLVALPIVVLILLPGSAPAQATPWLFPDRSLLPDLIAGARDPVVKGQLVYSAVDPTRYDDTAAPARAGADHRAVGHGTVPWTARHAARPRPVLEPIAERRAPEGTRRCRDCRIWPRYCRAFIRSIVLFRTANVYCGWCTP